MGRALIALALSACWRDSPAVAPAVDAPVNLRAAIDRLRTPAGAKELVNAASGLVFLDRFLEPGEPPGTMSEQHLCGPALSAFLRDHWAHDVGDAIELARGNGSIACNDRQLACRAGGRGEYDPVYHFRFARVGGTLALVAVSYDDEVLVGEDLVRAEHVRQQQLIDRLAKPCF